MARRPDYSHINIPALREFCFLHSLHFKWKNEEQGHAVIYSDEIECYIWVQRMVIELRKKNGVFLSKSEYHRGNRIFSGGQLMILLFGRNTKAKLHPRFRGGVAIIRVRESANTQERQRLLKESKELARRHSTLWP